MSEEQRTTGIRDRHNGTVLIVVLVLVVMMSVAATSYLLMMQTEHIAARSSGDRLAVEQAAFSGREFLARLLELSVAQRTELGGLTDNTDLFAERFVNEIDSDELGDAVRFAVTPPESRFNLERDDVVFGAVNESAKLHLARLVDWDHQHPESGKSALMRLSGMTPDVADAILDWVDDDSQPRLVGGEADAYAGLATPVRPRNGTPRNLEELLLVRGVTTRQLFGKAIRQPLGERNNGIDAVEVESGFDEHWSRYLTVCSGERNENRDGEARIFVNDPRLDVLHQQLVARMPIEWANFIVLFRQYGPVAAAESPETSRQVTVDLSVPAQHQIDSVLDLLDVAVTVPSDGNSASINSPFSSEPQVMQNQLPELIDQITVDPHARIEGRINVNLAPREVLLGIPEVDEILAERIIAGRSDGRPTAARDHDAWLLTEGLVDVATMRRLLPNITSRGDVFAAAFWGFAHQSSAVYRCESVLDATSGSTREIHFRDDDRTRLSVPTLDSGEMIVREG